MSTTVLPDSSTRPELSHGEGDSERFAHYVKKDEMMGSMVEGEPLTALCGKKWVPSRDPGKYPICPECKEIWESMSEGDGDGGE